MIILQEKNCVGFHPLPIGIIRYKRIVAHSGRSRQPIISLANQQEAEPRTSTHNFGGVVNQAQLQKWRDDDTTGVYQALDDLEWAIQRENPEMNLKFAEHVDSIEQMERGCHLLFPNILKHIVIPMGYAFVLYRLGSTKLVHGFTRLIDFHFWIFVVWAPIVLLFWYEKVKPQPETPEELRRLSPQYPPFVSNQKDPARSCSDHVRFLLEYWVSAVKAMTCVPFVKNVLLYYCGKRYTIPLSGVHFWMALTQFMTRIAAMASLYQYPEMMYRLQRNFQPRPMGFFPTILNTIVNAMLLVAPLGLLSDFSKILSSLHPSFISALYASVFLWCFGFWIRTRVAERRAKESNTKYCQLEPMKKSIRLCYGTLFGILWWKTLWPFGRLIRRQTRIFLTEIVSFVTPGYLIRACVPLILMAIPMIEPLVHIRAICKIIRILYCGDAPTMTVTSGLPKSHDRHDNNEQQQWRYRVAWRDPQRYGIMKEKILNWIGYVFLAKGCLKDERGHLLDEVSQMSDVSGNVMSERMAYELKNDPEAFSREPPSTWRARAMDAMSKKHETNYNTGNTTEDPLGIALWRAFGIGLGLEFYSKFQKELREGRGGNRRLQILAIEKAIHRYNVMRDTSVKLEEEEMQYLSETERNQRKEQRDHENQKELDYLAQKLSDLVPSTDDGMIDDEELFYQYFGRLVPEREAYKVISSDGAEVVEELISHSEKTSTSVNDTFLEDPFAGERMKSTTNVSSATHNEPTAPYKVMISPSVQAIIEDDTSDVLTVEPNSDTMDDEGAIGKDANDADVGSNQDPLDGWEPEIYYV